MSESIIDISRDFFNEEVKPAWSAVPVKPPRRPSASSVTVPGVAAGRRLSTDHHWGIRINALMPEELFNARNEAIQQTVSAQLPSTWRGQSLREGLSGGRGLSLTSLEGYLTRTIGLDHAPQTYEEWLSVPEEDIMHVVSGEVWHDPLGLFTSIRRTFDDYYPEPVRLRRIAHWCRYFSGWALTPSNARSCGTTVVCDYDVHEGDPFGIQLAFLLEKVFPTTNG